MTCRPRVLLVGVVDVDSGHGGAPMRVRALRSALAASADVRYVQPACDRPGRCSGAPPGVVDPFAHRFCPHAFDRLRAEVADWPADVVVLTELLVHRYATELARCGDVPVVFDMHNVEYPLRRAIGERAPAGSWPALNFTGEHCAAVRRVEHDTLLAVDRVWTCTETDKATALAHYPDVPADKIEVVPNAVPVPAVGQPAQPPAGPPDRMVFTGRLDYYPNIEAVQLLATEIGPPLRRRCPWLTVLVAGATATAETHAAAASGAIALVEDPVDTLAVIRGSIMAVPLRAGGGSRFKILEALAAGSPVVSTSKGAEGLDVVPGTHYLAADTTGDFVAAAAAVATDPALRAELGRAGLDLVRQQYSVDAITGTVGRQLSTLHRPGAPGTGG